MSETEEASDEKEIPVCPYCQERRVTFEVGGQMCRECWLKGRDYHPGREFLKPRGPRDG